MDARIAQYTLIFSVFAVWAEARGPVEPRQAAESAESAFRLPQRPDDSLSLGGPAASLPETPETRETPETPETREAPTDSPSGAKSWRQSRTADATLQPLDLQKVASRVAVATVLVLVACVLTLWLGQKWIRSNAGAGPTTSGLTVVGRLALTPKVTVHLVEVDGQRVLVAVDSSGVRSMTALSPSFHDALESADAESSMTSEPSSPEELAEERMLLRRLESDAGAASQPSAWSSLKAVLGRAGSSGRK